VAREFKTHFYHAGRDMVQGIIDGVGSMGQALENKMKELANKAKEAFKKEIESESPSKAFYRDALTIGEGIVLALDHSVDPVKRAATKLADATRDPFRNLSVGAMRLDGDLNRVPGVPVWRPEDSRGVGASTGDRAEGALVAELRALRGEVKELRGSNERKADEIKAETREVGPNVRRSVGEGLEHSRYFRGKLTRGVSRENHAAAIGSGVGGRS
jgi:hypothetical protein